MIKSNFPQRNAILLLSIALPCAEWLSLENQTDVCNADSLSTVRAWGRGNIKMSSYQYRDPHAKIRRSRDRLIFKMGIPILGKDGLYIETGPRTS